MNATSPPPADFRDEHCEALQEVANIGMGQAGDILARTLSVFVELSIPNIRIVTPEEVSNTIADLINMRSDVTAVRQGFFNHWHGEAIIVFDQNGCSQLAELMGYPKELDASSEVELFLDVGNVLAGACLNGIGETLGIQFRYHAPSILASRIAPHDLLKGNQLNWQQALLMEVSFGLKDHAFKSHLIVMLAEDSIPALCSDIERFIETI